MAINPQQMISVIDNSAAVVRAIEKLGKVSVMVGVPDDATARDGENISNATLAYIHENGSPVNNIPARPFLVPGVQAVQDRVREMLKRAGTFAVRGDEHSMMQQLHSAGMIASQSAKRMITAGLAPPLAPSTIRGRLKRTARGQKMLRTIRKAGTDLASWGADNMKPLYDTGRLLRSITYVVRIKGEADVKAQNDG